MATSAFKSTSRRPTTSSSTSTTNKQQSLQQSRKQSNSTQKVPIRRSRSVSAFSRTQLDTTTEFHNKRDNPLFWVDGSPNSHQDNIDNDDGVKLSNFDTPKFVGLNNVKGSSDDSRRGRSVSRSYRGETKLSGGGGARKDFGRSLSRVDTATRRWSPSRGHYGNSESEREQQSKSSNSRSKSKVSDANLTLLKGRNKLARSASDLSEVLKGRSTWSSQHPAFETSDVSAISPSGSRTPHWVWDDVLSTSSVSEAEERIIKPVSEEKIIPLKDINGTTGGILDTVRSEVRQAISDMQNDLKDAMLRSSSDVIYSSSISDVAPDLENPNAVELVRDIREEFVKELEECEERSRKLRAELAAEEHREIELNKILNDIVPEPKTPLAQKIRTVRKASFERKKMSKHLEEEALAYFDECVSISTFDESDFSSLEDLPSNMVSRERVDLTGISSRATVSSSFGGQPQGDMQRSPALQSNEGYSISANLSCNNHPHRSRSLSKSSGTKPQFSFTPEQSNTTSLEEDVRNYVKIFSKDRGNESKSRNSHIARLSHHQNTQDYKLLVDRVSFRSRIESGGMLLCGGGVGLSVHPYSSGLW